uniref:Transposase (Putative), gypsy type n=1 Tax=Tanacetum cinerariifolium TaxID=118510 RepID=A0A699H3W4_TANCI|nr:transposase (putative), gypsy type [Tanacetum cinerariifolium]
MSCTIKGKPLVLPWGRTPRLDFGVRVSRILGFPSISLNYVSEPKWDPDWAGSAYDRDLRMLVPFRGCSLVRGSKGVPKDPFPKSFEFNAEHFATLVALSAPFHKYPKPFLCLVGISRYYTLDEDAYHEFLGDNDEGMDLLAFIQTADPTKVRVTERKHAEDKPRLLESNVERVVPLLLIAPTRASNELEASVDKLFDEGASARKRKTAIADAGGPFHPLKKLREDFGALGGASTIGKSMSAVQSLFTGAVLDAEARGEPIPTLPFVTSSVSATSEREDKSLTDFVPGLNLQTIGAPQRSSTPAMATVTTVTAAIDADVPAARAPVVPSLFGVGSSSIGRTDSVPGGFYDVSGSDFLIGGIHTVVDPDSDLQKVYVLRWSAINGFGLDDSQPHIREKRKLRAVIDEQAELLKTKNGEIESLKAQLLLKEAEAAKAIRLQAEVFKFESAEQSLWSEVGGFKRLERCLREREKNELGVKVTDLSTSVRVREQEVADLDAQVTAVKLKNDNLVGQDEKLEEVNEKFDKLCADFVDMALHQEEKFYPHLLTTISGRQWLLTYGIELAVAKFPNSTEYLSALGSVISKAVEKGMQEGLSARITHGAEGRQLADVAAYNPSAEADYLLGLTKSQHHINQLMVPIHHSPDQRVIGASALSLSLEISHSRVKKMRENIANHVSALRGVFVPLSEPLSATALEGMEGTFGSTPDAAATLSTTFVSASTIPSISTDDYEVAHVDGQGSATVDDETAAVDDMNLFVSNAELNISE